MASWKKVVVSGSNAELAQITSSGLDATRVVFTGTGGALTGSGGLTYTQSTETLSATKIVNDSAVADSRLTGSMSGSFVGEFVNSDGSAVGAAKSLQDTMAVGSTTSVAMTSSASTMLSGSGAIFAGAFKSTGSFNVNIDTGEFAIQNGDAGPIDLLTIDGNNSRVIIDKDNQGAEVRIGSTSQIAGSGVSIGTSIGTTNLLTVGVGLNNTDLALKVTGSANIKGDIIANAMSGSFSGSFEGNGSSLTGITAEWDGTRNGNSQITGSGAGPSLVLSGSTGDDLLVKKNAKVEGKILSSDFDTISAGAVTLFDTVGANDLTIDAATSTVKTTLFESATSVKSADFDTIAAGAVTLFDTVGANDLTIGASTSTVKTTLLESATSVKSADFDVLAAGNVTLFDAVGDNDLTIGASTTTVKLPGDRIELGNGTGDIVDIKGDLRVAGTSSFTNATNLSVADKYILLNSGSAGANLDSGGIVIQGPNQNVGQLFGFVSGSSLDSDGLNRRWGIANNFNASASGDFSADAFMATVAVDTAASNPLATAYNIYAKPGNIYSGNDGEIYIYAQ